jgi:hypothetical protein
MGAVFLRFVIAAIVAALVVGLFVWQQRREALMHDCAETGGIWDGPQSTCHYPGGRMLVRPDLKRV